MVQYNHGTPQVALVVKNSPPNAGDIRDTGWIPGSGRSPAGGHENPLQHSCLENPKDRGVWWVTVQRVAKSWTRPKWLSTHAIWSQKLAKAELKEGVRETWSMRRTQCTIANFEDGGHVSRKWGPQSCNQKELYLSQNLSKLRSRFFPRTSTQEPSSNDNLISASWDPERRIQSGPN